MLLFTLIRSDHLKHSMHTNCQQVALMHTLVPCVCVQHQNTCFFYAFYWDEPEHLKLRFEKKIVFLTLCITLLGVIIWKSQRIQTPKTRTLV